MNRPVLIVILPALLAVALSGCGPKKPDSAPQNGATPAPSLKAHQPGLFVNVAQKVGLQFNYSNGEAGEFKMIETTPGGCAFLDYNQDGLQDIFLIQSGPTPGAPPPAGGGRSRPPCALFRNDGDEKFTEVTQEAGIDKIDQGYAQAVAVGDYDNDGYPDLYITSYGGNFLLHNDKQGHFVDVTAQAKVANNEDGKRWATSAAWGDYDRDGFLDLIVLHYTHWQPGTDKPCTHANKVRTYCSPEVYPADEYPTLYRNNGKGAFIDVTRAMGVDKAKGRGLGVIFTDYDQDGWPDIYIACDITPNMMLHNQKGKGFIDKALPLGVSVGADAAVLSGMGVSAGDYDNKGWESIVVTNFSGQPNSLYHALGNGEFEDYAYQSGVGEASLNFLAWGVEFVDYDNDGLLDIVVGNGHVDPFVSTIAPNSTYKERKLLFRNQGDGIFKDDTESLGDMWEERVTRGLAVADYNNDGRMDVLDNSHNMPVHLYRNEGKKGGFAAFRLEGVKSNRDAAGALVWATAGGRRRLVEVRNGSSYASTSDRRVHYGLGDATQVDKLEVRWPSGAKQTFANLPGNAFYYLREGEKPVPDPKVSR